jgi:uncharacterized protein CbrC (UPF0167 family)
MPAISGQWLAKDDNGTRRDACAECLAIGKAHTDAPSWIERDLLVSVEALHPDWSIEQRSSYVAARIAELSRSPPIAWIQNNEWPVCGEDFAAYVGELTREGLERQYGGIEPGNAALRRIIEQERPAWPEDEETLEWHWSELGNFLAKFVFRCLNDTQRDIHVLQLA